MSLLIRLLPYIIGVVGFMSLLTGAYVKGRMDCKTSQEIKQLTQTVEDQEALNEIRNNRPDTAVLIDALRMGSF